MNIRNYTSGVAVETTIARIESKLASIGILGITKWYGPNAQVSALLFDMPDGKRVHSIRVPANVDACAEALWKEHCKTHTRPRPETKKRIQEQAARTAWRLVQDWIEIQCTMIIMKQKEPLEAFMSDVWNGTETYYQHLKANQFKALPERT